MAEVVNNRSGRVVIDKNAHKQIVIADSGNMGLIYRIFNGGKDGTQVKLYNDEPQVGDDAIFTLQWKDSVDITLRKKSLWILAGANDAEVVYELVGVTS